MPDEYQEVKAHFDRISEDTRQRRAEHEEVLILRAQVATLTEALQAVVAMYGPSTDYGYEAAAVWRKAEAALAAVRVEPRCTCSAPTYEGEPHTPSCPAAVRGER